MGSSLRPSAGEPPGFAIRIFLAMPVYAYKALKEDGAADAGVIDADSPKEARLKLKGRRLHVTELEPLAQREGGGDCGSGRAGGAPRRWPSSPARWPRFWAPASP